MGIIGIFKESNGEKERELMKALCLGIAGDIARQLSDKGFNKAINVFELTIFASFIVTDSYILSKNLANKNSSITNTQLDKFHLDLSNYVINEFFLKEAKNSMEDVLKFREEFYNHIQARYLEYRPSFVEDMRDVLNRKPGVTIPFFNTLNKFMKYFFVIPPKETEQLPILILMSIVLVAHIVGD